MKTFLVHDESSNQVIAKVKANDRKDICNPYTGPLMKHYVVPENINPSDAKLELIDGTMTVVEDQDLKAARLTAELSAAREFKLQRIRDLRAPKLARVDQLVNIAFLASWTAGEKTELRNYRTALLDITEDFKADMPSLDAINPESLAWPEEPTEV